MSKKTTRTLTLPLLYLLLLITILESCDPPKPETVTYHILLDLSKSQKDPSKPGSDLLSFRKNLDDTKKIIHDIYRKSKLCKIHIYAVSQFSGSQEICSSITKETSYRDEREKKDSAEFRKLDSLLQRINLAPENFSTNRSCIYHSLSNLYRNVNTIQTQHKNKHKIVVISDMIEDCDDSPLLNNPDCDRLNLEKYKESPFPVPREYTPETLFNNPGISILFFDNSPDTPDRISKNIQSFWKEILEKHEYRSDSIQPYNNSYEALFSVLFPNSSSPKN